VLFSFELSTDYNQILNNPTQSFGREAALSCLINEALEWDVRDNTHKAPKDRTSKPLSDLISQVHPGMWCFIRCVGEHDFTSLMGSHKKLLMKHLPDKLNGIIKPKNCNSVVSRSGS
jgi:hypothetical protein